MNPNPNLSDSTLRITHEDALAELAAVRKSAIATMQERDKAEAEVQTLHKYLEETQDTLSAEVVKSQSVIAELEDKVKSLEAIEKGLRRLLDECTVESHRRRLLVEFLCAEIASSKSL
jgi:chromosome segregation ATPase